MKRSRKALGAGVALCAAGLSFAVTVRPAHTQADPASRAIEYLQSQQSAVDGSIPSSPGSYGPTELYTIAAAAAGYDPNAMRAGSGPSAMDYLAAHAADACNAPGRCGELIQAVVAAGRDLHAFAGLDLVANLTAGLNAGTGAYGDGQAFTQALAVQGLASAGSAVPSAALAYMRTAQNSDGGWDYLDIHDDPNPNDFATSDTNSTAMTLMALDAAGDHSRDAGGLAWLHTQQNSDGGFPYQAGSASDPDSTALVVQAILGSGGNPDATAWTKGGHTPLQQLLATQGASGGYTFPGNPTPDAFTTSQVPLALLRQPLPAASAFAAGLTPAAEQRATVQALKYLNGQQTADGAFTGVSATYDPSELFAIGAAAAGFDPKTLRSNAGLSVMDYLAAHAATATAKAGQTGRLIQAVQAAGLDPHAFGGLDLVGVLQGFYAPGTGAYGDGQAFSQTLALQALAGLGVATPANAVSMLAQAQDSDGGWNYLLIRNDPNPNDFASSDTNSTAMALMALAATGDHSRDATALAWLRTQQSADRGFPYQAGGPSDPDSTALVIQAIVASGGNPGAAPWAAGGHSPYSALIGMQDASGGYAFPGNASADVFTTAQVPVALARVAFPVAFAQRAFYSPGATLGSTTSPTQTAAPPTQPVAGPVTAPGNSGGGRQRSAASASAATSTPAPATPTSSVSPVTSPPTAAPSATPRTSSTPAGAAATPGGPLPVVYVAIAVIAAALVAGAGVLWTRRR